MPAVGAIVQTQTFNGPPERSSTVNRIVLAWVSDASGGAVSGIPTTFPVNGVLLAVEFVPDGGGTAPTNLYDVTLTDTAGVDVLGGQGANLANNANTVVCPGVAL